MKSSFRKIHRKVWERLSGIEPRRLWSELANTRNELANTRNELANTRNELANTRNELANTRNELANTRNEPAIVDSPRHKRLHPYISEALNLVSPDLRDSFQLPTEINPKKSLFAEFGSDKDTRHSYGEIYFNLLKNEVNPKILEIGVGSVNDFPYAGLPAGGGLQAFRKKFPDSEIIGLDIDPESIELIKELGFQGYILDQTSDESLAKIKKALHSGRKFDLIVDDGFHDPHANIRTLKSFFELLSDNGTYVIEDIHETLIDLWKTISVHLPGKMEILDMRDLRPGVDDNILILLRK